MKKNTIILPIVTLAIAGFAFFGVASAQAHGLEGDSTMIAKLANKLGVSEDKVKVAFDSIHTEHKQEMEAKQLETLNKAVTDGKITEAQKTLILEKRKEMDAKRETNKETMKDKTPEEMKTQMEAERTELQTWATANNIDISYLRGPMKVMHFRGGDK